MSKKLFVAKNLCIFLLGILILGSSLPVDNIGKQKAGTSEDYSISLMSDIPEEEIRLD